MLEAIRKQMARGVEYIQIREKDLTAREIYEFTRAVIEARGVWPSKVLVNERWDIAWCAKADGVHLPAYSPHVKLPGLIIGRSCHSEEEVRTAKADFVTFSPIFESPGKGGAVGLEALRMVCLAGVPVFALGGITWANAPACIEAGAAGIAGIRLFLNE